MNVLFLEEKHSMHNNILIIFHICRFSFKLFYICVLNVMDKFGNELTKSNWYFTVICSFCTVFDMSIWNDEFACVIVIVWF